MMSRKINKIALLIANVLIITMAGIIAFFIIDFVGLNSGHADRPILSSQRLGLFLSINAIICYFTLYISNTFSKKWAGFLKKEYIISTTGVCSGIALTVLITELTEKPATVPFIIFFFIFASISVIAFRYFTVKIYTIFPSIAVNDSQERTLIVGGGQACKMILTDIENARKDINNPFKNIFPICIVDDDKKKLKSNIRNIPILGTTDNIIELCKSENISLVLFAIPSASIEERKRILDICAATKLKIKIVPYLGQILVDHNDSVHLLKQVKDIKIEDLLGRDPITFDKQDIKELVKGKVSMVTGGGGSIGSELVRQIAKYHPKQIVIVDIYENNAYDIQQELFMEHGDKLNLVTLIASVRDYDKMKLIFEKYKPDLVFHAAAHKHVPLMETSPEEAVKNNVVGTYNCATLANEYKVKKFIMISTDKAVNPTNVMGATKRCCEMIVQHMAQKGSETEFITTRFGNVLGSNGSVIPLFKRQIESGKPVTVTDPEIIRYFMTIPEAVSLVLQAGAMAKGGEIFVLDMGAPVKILSLAENLIRMYGKVPYKDVEIKFTGLRSGEKLFEELLMDEEGLKSTSNKKIFIGKQILVESQELINNLELLRNVAEENNSEKTIELLKKIVPTFKRQ
ncbi:MAG: nucleoside-diphosphate sugar epimerase/dehydratase [Bacillota bacterium]|nr:nucleoside-diphosphate sugar epimerase/dehydratase [Bacillota bacterium]